ncbi:MAG: diguanylate cyclase [Gallionellaceae bacterium]
MVSNSKPLRLKVAGPEVKTRPLKDWRILVVDDDNEVHAVTRMILGKVKYKGRGIELLSAHSAAEAREILEHEQGIATILLDVVMETDDAGLQLVRVIREEIANAAVRIILRTGQPGQAPEERVIVDYDINDYKAKSELTAQKLFTTVIASLRSYETIMSLEKTRKGLEKILDSSSTLFQVHSIQQFASGVLTQLSGFLDCQPNGIICAQLNNEVQVESPKSCEDMQILATTGEYSDCMGCQMDNGCKHAEIMGLIHKSMIGKKNVLTDDYTVLYLGTNSTQATVALLHGGLGAADENDQQLLKVFSSKISIALENALNYQKMISAEAAATTDFLTGLNNRRQLLRIGVPLVAGACRVGTPLAVAMIDIDYFKRVNDTWGHDAGDEVLRSVAVLLQDRFRSSDVVARFGGEEFCVIASNLTAVAAYELFESFRLSLAELKIEISGKQISVTVSIGLTTTVADSVDTMISFADQLLYRAKQQGRNQVMVG